MEGGRRRKIMDSQNHWLNWRSSKVEIGRPKNFVGSDRAGLPDAIYRVR